MAKNEGKTTHKFFSERSKELCTEVCVIATGRARSQSATPYRQIDWRHYAKLKAELIREHMRAMDDTTLARAHSTIDHIEREYGRRI